MNDLPSSVRPVLRRLARRVAIGHFLDVWPIWAVGSLFIAGFIALICRLLFETFSPVLPWLWLAPIMAAVPASIVCFKRAYRPMEIVALADSLSGGQGTLLTLFEIKDAAWSDSRIIQNVSTLTLPRLHPWRRLWPVFAAAAFLMMALLMPQRIGTGPGNMVLANDMADELKATVEELKEQELITTAEQKKLEEEIERIRKSALERMDSSSWEAADALRENVAASLSEKQDALKWAQESLARSGAAGGPGSPSSSGQNDELAKAIEKLAQMGLLSDAPEELKSLLGGQRAVDGGKAQLPIDPASLRRLSELLSAQLAGRAQRFGEAAKLAKEFGRFDASEFPLFSDEQGPDGDGDPGRGGINRGRGDADLTWGKESLPHDRFKAVALPPGAARSPDDWAPVITMPGAPKESPGLSTRGRAVGYADTSGQAAWRRSLAPRHQSAVKKYFDTPNSR